MRTTGESPNSDDDPELDGYDKGERDVKDGAKTPRTKGYSGDYGEGKSARTLEKYEEK